MVRIVKTEFYKLKRYHILWAGVALMLLSVLLTLFTSMANDGSVWDFAYLTEQVIKNNMSMIFPMCISLIAGYMISREQTDDTLKNILTVPISFKKLLTGKLIVCGVLSIIFGLICSLFTIIAEMIVGFPGFEISLALKAALQITAVNFFLYLAVLPIIALTCRRAGGFLVGVIIAFVYGYGGMFAAGNMTFGSNLAFVQDRLSAERYFSRGNHYEEYRDYWENGNYTFSRNENPELVYVRARDIEGVYLSDRELGNPEGFWTRNGREGWSRENILRRASHIQDVRQNTESGMSLDELSQNPVLDDTIRSYYNNPVQVAQVGSYYVFQSDGRHRTLAAQSLDTYIPVLVTGSYTRND